jgi:hypothetical protein
VDEFPDQKTWATTDVVGRTISLRQGLPWRDLKETVLHELVHTFLNDIGMDSQFRNEDLCSGLASVMTDFFEDNPEWMKVLGFKESRYR